MLAGRGTEGHTSSSMLRSSRLTACLAPVPSAAPWEPSQPTLAWSPHVPAWEPELPASAPDLEALGPRLGLPPWNTLPSICTGSWVRVQLALARAASVHLSLLQTMMFFTLARLQLLLSDGSDTSSAAPPRTQQ